MRLEAVSDLASPPGWGDRQPSDPVVGACERKFSVAQARKRGEAGEGLVNLNARVPKHLWRRVRLQCLREGCLLRSFITEALNEHLRPRARR